MVYYCRLPKRSRIREAGRRAGPAKATETERKAKAMKILGIDPGYAILGYGIIEKTGNRFRPIHYGAVTTPKEMPMDSRLEHLYDSLREIIDEYRPDAASIEELFFNNNAKTAIYVGQARGVAILACVKARIQIAEYTPTQIKQALVGYGRADKQQVQYMVRTVLNLPEVPRPDDTADALAAAICHGHSVDSRNRIMNGLKGRKGI